MVSFRDSYDVTPREKAILEEKAARRLELRNEYLKKFHNPYKPEGTMFDAPIQRFTTLRATRREFFKPTALNALWHFGIIFAPIIIYTYVVKKSRDTMEHQYRTGQISYKDRFNKFA